MWLQLIKKKEKKINKFSNLNKIKEKFKRKNKILTLVSVNNNVCFFKW